MTAKKQYSKSVFVSHSAKDVKLAEALVKLLEKALNIPAKEIRCTSVNGYRLPAGAPTDMVLRKEVHESRVLIGLITPSSMASAYVMFELGARWGAGSHLVPLLGAGADVNDLRGHPLSALNALNCGDAAQVHQLVDDVAKLLGIDERTPTAAYQDYLDRFIEASKPVHRSVAATLPPRNDAEAQIRGSQLSKQDAVVSIGLAAKSGDLGTIRELLKGNPDLLFRKGNSGWTPLHDAAKHGRKDVVELLLANKADANAKDRSGWTPLHEAAGHGRKDIVELLLASKAEVNAKDVSDWTPLHEAAAKGCSAVTDLLLTKKAEVNAKDTSHWTPLHYAAKHGSKDVVELLLANKAEVNAKDASDWTPLHEAAKRGHQDLVKVLLANKADVNAKDQKGWTPLQWAASQGTKDVLDLLRQHGGHE